jgi:CrcB protein
MDRETLRLYGLVALGGAAGALLRALATAHALPWSVFAVNVGGSLLIGVILTLSLEAARIGAEARTLLTTGVLGSFTTFSTFVGGIVSLARSQPAVAVLYGLGSLVAGLAAALAGQALVRVVWLRSDGEGEESR